MMFKRNNSIQFINKLNFVFRKEIEVSIDTKTTTVTKKNELNLDLLTRWNLSK